MEGSPGHGINTALVPGSASLKPTTLYTLPLAGCGPGHRVPELVRTQRAVSNGKKDLESCCKYVITATYTMPLQ